MAVKGLYEKEEELSKQFRVLTVVDVIPRERGEGTRAQGEQKLETVRGLS